MSITNFLTGVYYMKKTILTGIFALAFAFSSAVKADISLSGYTEFLAGSVDQVTADSTTNHGIDQAGMDNGTYSRLTATYSSTLDNGIDVSGVMNATTRDCQGNKDGVCDVVNFNFVTLSGGFGSISVGERFAAGAAMLSRLTAANPSAEPDGGNTGAFYTTGDANYGGLNEVNYANNSVKILYSSNVYSGFSFAASYAPNTSNTGQGATRNGQQASGDTAAGTWAAYNDLISVFGKYAMDIDGIGLELVYGQQMGNAGRDVTTDYNDLDETAYSARITYGNLMVDYRKNDAGNSGRPKNDGSGNDSGTSMCATYMMGNIGMGACNLESSFTTATNTENTQKMTQFYATYELGGGMRLAATYFDHEQDVNSVVDTDADGIVTRLSIGF